MFPPDVRILTGDVAAPQQLAELELSTKGIRLTMPGHSRHLLLVSLRGGLACFENGLAWHLPSACVAWLLPAKPLTLRATQVGGAHLLAWRFDAHGLPDALRVLLPATATGPALPLLPLTPSMQTLVVALRGCPVAPTLRNLWGTAKLIELITLVLPPANPPDASSYAVSSAARVLHPGIRHALEYLVNHLDAPIGLSEIAAAAHASPSHLSRLFTAEFGHGPTAHLRRLRMEHASRLLATGRANVTEAALAVGYQSLGQFSRAFSEHHGRPPSAFIPRNTG